MPSLGMITINALAAADSVIIPTQPHYLSAKGLELLLRSVSMVKRQINPKLRIDGISVSNTLIFLPYALLTVAVISLEMLVRGITIVIKIPSIRILGLICRLTIDTERSKSSRPLAER